MLDPVHIGLALGFGALIGFALGVLGAGGSILTVPILVYAMGFPVPIATGTSLAIVGLNAAAGAVDYHRRGLVLPKTGIAFGASGLLGAFGGVWLNHQVRGEVVLVLFALLMVGAAISLVRGQSTSEEAEQFQQTSTAAGWLKLAVVGLAVGFLTGFFGVGGGFLVVPALVLVIGLPMKFAVGTSLLVIALNALWGLLGHLRFGGLDWGVTALFIGGGLVGVVGGGKLAGLLSTTWLRRAFAGLILSVAVYTFSQSVGVLAGR